MSLNPEQSKLSPGPKPAGHRTRGLKNKLSDVPNRIFEEKDGGEPLSVHPDDVCSWMRHPDYMRDRPLTTFTCYDGSVHTVVCDFREFHRWALRPLGGNVIAPHWPLVGAQKAR